MEIHDKMCNQQLRVKFDDVETNFFLSVYLIAGIHFLGPRLARENVAASGTDLPPNQAAAVVTWRLINLTENNHRDLQIPVITIDW